MINQSHPVIEDKFPFVLVKILTSKASFCITVTNSNYFGHEYNEIKRIKNNKACFFFKFNQNIFKGF